MRGRSDVGGGCVERAFCGVCGWELLIRWKSTLRIGCGVKKLTWLLEECRCSMEHWRLQQRYEHIESMERA
jgi:hypothetical protein